MRPVLVAFLVLLSFSALAADVGDDAVETPASEDETALDEFLEEAEDSEDFR